MTDNVKRTYSGCTLCYHSCGIEVDVAGGRVVNVQGQKSYPLKIKNIFLPTEGEGQPLGTQKYPLFYELWGRTSPYGIVSMVIGFAREDPWPWLKSAPKPQPNTT